MALWQWSTTPATNASAGLIDWAEGQPPSTVNDSARQMMADVATWFQAPEWLNFGLVPTFVSATQFTTPNNQTGIYTVGRRVRAFVSAGTIFGTITASVFTSLTTVTVTWDSGSLDSGVSEVDVGILNPAFPSLNTLPSLTLSAPLSGANIKMIGSGTTTPTKTLRVNAGSFFILNDAGNTGIVQVDDSGNLTAIGDITSSSDESLKKDWEALPEDYLERLAEVLHGTFTRIDTGERQAGVGARSLSAVLEQFVHEGADGMLSVAYGQAALVSVIALTREVLRLRGLLELVK